jgi:hypothetical protein
MSIDFQRLERVRTARRGSQRKRWVKIVSTLALVAATVAVSAGVVTRTVPFLSRGAALVGEALGEARGQVEAVEPVAGIVRVSSGFLGLLSVDLVVSPETLIVIGDKEGGFGDLREGQRVVATYEIRPDALRATRVEVFGRSEPRPSGD